MLYQTREEESEAVIDAMRAELESLRAENEALREQQIHYIHKSAVQQGELDVLRPIAEAARKLDTAMEPHKFALLDTAGSDDWDWAWDQLADALGNQTPNC